MIAGTFWVAMHNGLGALLDQESLRNRLLEMANSTIDFVSIFNPEGQILYINPAGRELVGISRDEDVSLLKISDFHPQWALKELKEEVLPTLAEEGVWSGELSLLKRDGSTFPTSYVGIAHRSTDGSVQAFSVISRDMREVKEVERELKTFRALMDQSNDSIFLITPESWQFLDINGEACKNLGYSREALLEMTLADIEVGFTQSLKWHKYLTEVKSAGFLLLEGELKRKDGSTLPVEISVKYISLKDQNYLVAVARDLTLRKKYDRELTASREGFRNVVERNSDAIVVIDPGGNILFANQACKPVFGKESKELIGHKMPFSMHRGMPGEVEFVHKEKGKVTLSINMSESEWNQKPALLSTIRDVTSYKEMEKQLQTQKESLEDANLKLQELNQVKTNFVSTVSHELRTPLTVIMSSANNLLEGIRGELSEGQKKAVQKIVNHSSNLNQMINDLLDLSKMESGKIELQPESGDFANLAKPWIESLRTIARNKNISLTAEFPAALNPVWIDPERIQQVITNLVTNALKFTPEGGKVILFASQKKECLEVTVSDNGPGIPPDYCGIIFERFQQIKDNQPKARSTQGMGLGLSICKEIVLQHGGRIWVESQVGEGSQFKFTLPNVASVKAATSRHILVVDDDDEICGLVEAVLTSKGYPVTTCQNGADAIQLVQENPNQFGLILQDLMLPGTTGVEVVEAVRKAECLVPIVIITAYPNSESLFKAMAHGPLTILSKPFNPDHLMETVYKLLPKV